MHDYTKEINEYVKDRDQAVTESIRTDSVEPFKAFIRKHSNAFPKCFEVPSDGILEISIRQMAIHCTDIEPEIKGKAVEWLVSRGCKLDIYDE